MKILLLTFLFVVPSFCFTQNVDNSIGVVSLIKGEENRNIQIFNKDGTIWYEFNTKCISSYSKCDDYFTTIRDKLNILCCNVKSSYLEFTCVSETDSLYEVIIDQTTKLTKWVKEAKYLKLDSWQGYILSSSIIYEENKFFSDSLRIKVIPKKSDCLIKPVEIHDDWMKVRWNVNCFEDISPNYKNAWVKWKENNTVIIKYLFLI